MSLAKRRAMVEPSHPQLSVVRQCALVGLSRSGVYHRPKGESAATLTLMRLIDEAFLEHPFYGARQMMLHLRRLGHRLGRHRVRRLMGKMGLAPIYQKPKTSVPHPQHPVYPYLLRDLPVTRPNQVWCADITYIPMRRGFLYLVAIMDWSTRMVLAWRLSNTMEADFCIEALTEALAKFGSPEIFNTDQGSQFTSPRFTVLLTQAGVRCADQHGWPGPVDGQCLHRAALEVAEIRVRVYPRLRDGFRSAGRAGALDRLLQRREAPYRP